jgi:hypothetical protein
MEKPNNKKLTGIELLYKISYLIQYNIYNTSKWLKYDEIYIYNDVVNIFKKIQELYLLEEYHFVITYIYFKRLLNIGGIHNKPFFLFVLSFILCIKFWTESNTVCIYPPVYIKNLLKYEIYILNNTYFSFYISQDLFIETYNIIFFNDINI